MSTLVIQLPSRARLAGGDARTPPRDDATEFAYVLTPDGINITRQGRTTPALMPKADSAVVVLAEQDVSWHLVTVPKAPAARLRAAIAGLLEEQLLEEPDVLHFALAPGTAAGRRGFVAVMDKAWLRGHLSAL
ncbi:MAG: type II secretion system protein GspL, partial [Aquincola sp.]|nr:type II secretion system protein GspL [Aquincola sp.]